jgi:hypothetical protein
MEYFFISLVLLAACAEAHIRFVYPPPRSTDSGIKGPVIVEFCFLHLRTL